MKKYYSIGEIAKIYNISVDTLRYYEKIGLLKPALKRESGYRYYSNEQIWKLNNIRNLRALGVSLTNIMGFLKSRNIDSTEKILNSQLIIIERELNKFKKLKKEVLIKKANLEFFKNNVIFETPRLINISKRHIIKSKGKIKDSGDIDFKMKLLSIKTVSENDFLFIENEFGGTLSVENFKNSKYDTYEDIFIISNNSIENAEFIPSGEYISFFYRGDYSKNHEYYSKIKDFINSQNLEIRDNIFEIFHVDIHATENPEEYITEIQIPVRGKNSHKN